MSGAVGGGEAEGRPGGMPEGGAGSHPVAPSGKLNAGLRGGTEEVIFNIDLDGVPVTVTAPADRYDQVAAALSRPDRKSAGDGHTTVGGTPGEAGEDAPEHRTPDEAAKAIAEILNGSDEPEETLGRAMLIHTGRTGDAGAPLAAVALHMVAKDHVASDLARLITWLHSTGSIDRGDLASLGMNPVAADQMRHLLDEVELDPDDMEDELTIRRAEAEHMQAAEHIVQTSYGLTAGTPEASELMWNILMFAAENRIGDITLAHRLAAAEQPHLLRTPGQAS